MKIKVLLVFLILSICGLLRAQNAGVSIGSINNGVYEFNENQKSLVKAYEWTFKDGTKVNDMKIEQIGNNYYIVAICIYQGRKRTAAVEIELNGIDFVLKEDAAFKMCSAVACETCKFFLENNKIVACKCEETGTISNHCHYKASSGIGFYSNYLRAIKMSKEH
jgi:hypothetical protein